jgi:outer membrane protein OmpA-like peptidoglycan-associated protein
MRPDRRLAAALTLATLMTQGVAQAQPVQVFEYTPPLEQLRSILVPESTGAAARKIVLPRPDDLGAERPVQPAAAIAAPQPQPQPRPQLQTQPRLEPVASPTPAPMPASQPTLTPVVAAAPASMPMPAAPAAPSHPAPGVVGFRIQFALDSTAIPAAADPFLDRLAELMQQEPQVMLLIEGHTDAYGSDQYNVDLSKRRAESVGMALVERGIVAKRITIAGKGKHEPLVEDPYDARNRRVQFVRMDGAAQ